MLFGRVLPATHGQVAADFDLFENQIDAGRIVRHQRTATKNSVELATVKQVCLAFAGGESQIQIDQIILASWRFQAAGDSDVTLRAYAMVGQMS